MPAGDVFGLDGFFLNKSNPVTVSFVDINTASSSAGIAITGGSFSAGTVTLNLSNAAGLTTTPFYTGTIIGVSSISQAGIAHTAYNGTFVVTGFAGTTTVSYATTGYVGSVTASIGATTIGYIQLLTDGNVTNTTWSSAQTHGWFGGGNTPTPAIFSTVDRINFSNDTGTANIRGPLSSARSSLAATGNSNYGWFGGGSPGPLSRVDRIDFSNDSATSIARGSLFQARWGLSATGNSNFGWFGGGFPGPGAISRVDRIDFSNDSPTASIRGLLSLARYTLASTGNSNYGWFGGGRAGSPVANTATVDRIDFSNDSSTALARGPLSSARYGMGATGNSNYGWFAGGGSSPIVSRVDRIDYSNDSTSASPRGPLSSARYGLAATGNSNYGWFGGGFAPGATYTATVNRVDFSNDTATSSPRGSLSLARSSVSATSGVLNIRRQKAGNYGWFGGGSTTVLVATVDRIDFSNDSPSASVRGPLSLARSNSAATGNSNYGWFGGGQIPGPLINTETVERIDFSNDSSTASVRGSLSLARSALAATGNSNYGWFGGGLGGTSFPLTTVATVDRINFSNDSTTVSTRGPLSPPRVYAAATGNSNYGWFGGGYAPGRTATVDRIDFSNDSPSALVRGPLSLARDSLAATGNSNYGWFGGGKTPTTATVDRIDFSNDSPTASFRGPLSSVRYFLAATGNSNYGWFGGGYSPSIPLRKSTVDRIDFSNDSVSASQRGPLSTSPGRYSIAATSNTNK
jgi:hypothetical protein